MKFNLRNNWFEKPRWLTVMIASILVVLITWQPYYLIGKINTFELGIYLPGIQAIIDGKMPYRDFFHLRGPLEIYMPAWLMQVFGNHVAVLCTYFYVATVLTLIIWLLVSTQIFRTRLIFLLFTLILVSRTFPRVVFTFWGGMRYALGALTIFFAILFFKKLQKRWLFLASFCSVLAFFTSVEMGFCSIVAICSTLLLSSIVFKEKKYARSLMFYVLCVIALVSVYLSYLFSQDALGAYWDVTSTVILNMQKVFDLQPVSHIPKNLAEAVFAMVNPGHDNFKHLTPMYAYLAFGFFLVINFHKRKEMLLPVLCVAIYGFSLYITSFRNIEASQFEMALQPEKIVYFFLLEEVFFFLKNRFVRKVNLNAVFIIIIVTSSLIFSFSHFSRRYIAFRFLTGQSTKKLIPLRDEEKVTLDLPRLKHMTLPKSQAQDFEQLVQFFNEHTTKQDSVFCFPEMGFQSFIIDRPFVGHFPMYTFSWLKDDWHEELLSQLRKNPPQYIVCDLNLESKYEEQYFKVVKNKEKFDELLDFINKFYVLVDKTPTLGILEHKKM